jgi:hypothetical protein
LGAAYFIVLNRKPESFDPSVNGKDIARASDELRGVAERLDVPALETFYSTRPGELAELGLDAEAEEPPTEVVLELRLGRDPLSMYYVREGAVYRCRRKQPGKPSPQPEIASAIRFVQEDDWMYFVDEQGNVVRTPKDWRPSPKEGEPSERWFDPAAARKTFQALWDYANEKGKAELAQDLGRFLEVLEKAAEEKLQFHLAIDI